MPQIKSAKKALRQSKKRKARNLKRKESIRRIALRIKKLVKEGKKDEAKTQLRKAYKLIDKAAKSYLHKNTASRKKSRLTALINKKRSKSTPASP